MHEQVGKFAGLLVGVLPREMLASWLQLSSERADGVVRRGSGTDTLGPEGSMHRALKSFYMGTPFQAQVYTL